MKNSSSRAPVTGVLALLLLFLVFAAPALAQRRYPPGPPQVLPEIITRDGRPGNDDDVLGTRFHGSPDTAAEVAAETAADSDVLPLTGAEVTMFALGGIATIAAGTTLVRVGRRRNR